MRSLAECKAEILCRSEKKIKERKQLRKSILTWCIALTICFGIGAGIVELWPQKKCKSEEVGNDKGSTRGDEEVASGSSAIAVELELRSADGIVGERFYTKEPQEVMDLYTSIESLYKKTSDVGSENFAVQGGTSEKKNESYVIVFRMADGLEKKYTWDGEHLTNETTNETILLTASQAQKLNEELHITK